MKPFILYFLSVLIATGVRAQTNRISWKEGAKLNWSDFTGRVDLSSQHDAETRYGIDYKYKWAGDGTISVTVLCYFDKELSWKKDGEALTTHLLHHEQVHFDIAELFARKLRKAFASYTAHHRYGPESKAEITGIFQKHFEEAQRFQDEYDLDTDHSKLAEKQAEWNRKIAALLAELNDYK